MKGQLKFIIVMLIFGSIGIFVKGIDLSSSEIALLRGAVGSIFLVGASFLVKNRVSFSSIKRNLLLLMLSGGALGFNWIFLFEAYRYTTIASATLSYYFAPIFVMVLAPFVLKEKLTIVKAGSILVAMTGLFLVVSNGSGLVGDSGSHVMGIMYGLLAAVLYASVILMNKFIKNQSDFDTTVVQLMVAAIVLLPYVLVKEDMNLSGLDPESIILILVLGIIHTGVAYLLYFSAIKQLKGQSIAILSYIDPISAVIFAAIFLAEGMTLLQIVGGILILGSTFLGEKLDSKLKRRIPSDANDRS